MISIVVDGDRKRAQWRKTAVVWRAAMRKALAMIPAGEATLLDAADAIGASPGLPIMTRIAWADVIQFERENPDIALWAPVLIGAINPAIDAGEAIDAIFVLGMAIEGKSETSVADAHAALLALLA